MLNKKSFFIIAVAAIVACGGACADDVIDDTIADDMDAVSADAVSEYQVEGSLFQQITELEQEKVLMQLEKERAQLDLELDRLAAEKIKLHMEIDTLSGRAEAQQQELETEKAKLEAEAARIAREKESLAAAAAAPAQVANTNAAVADEDSAISDSFRLINVIGAGSQLQATVEDLGTGQTKRIRTGTSLNGYMVKSISLDDGVVFIKDGKTETLNIGAVR
ncbi:hypothetical protein HDR61_01900 [bacterium]|nr:hypothetical protein [bacterium]